MDARNDTDDTWLTSKRHTLAAIELEARATGIGRVEQIADGIAFVSGLPDVALDELVDIECGVAGYVHALDVGVASVVLLDSSGGVKAGMRVTRRGTVLDVPVGESLLGRVVDPLGRPLDGGGLIQAEGRLPIERPAPAIVARDFVSEPLETGVLIIDALFAVGRGQRELIIGDRATGKTSLAVDAIVNQKHGDVICVYVAVGQRSTAVQRVVDAIRQYGAPERCIVVVASAASPPGLQWIAPFAGFSIAEYFRDRGQHALIVIDDLTKHAATHRELALLTREPPGREAYPGDIFYLHARLLERAAKLSAELGGGSLTALPIAETEAGNLSAYIPTNLISITDGQVVLDAGLFAANQRPAVDVGLSVSRVGGKAQHPALRDVAGRLRLEYAQFLELEVFSRFGGLADARVTAQIERGRRIRALFAQPRFAALRTVDQIALLVALADGLFDGAPLDALARTRQKLKALDIAQALAGDAGGLRGSLDAAQRQRLSDVLRDIIGRARDELVADATPKGAPR
ncbi:F0F1 ATP synthase subunit alpha [Paraburkholderia caribensis]|uniref:F0F1 ATP synthase subunit alpha n=1 Tax=Paraburkholderia caribensis TaxID=75105 RepID=UPI0006D40C36|nr:F0F1 ATP synthase subunit alpha [Paraburkholderia caribensis]AMV45740.1 ATP synthase subunit alpha [Paraburkholderia caribensis]CAG9192538.1 ATP synthase subunit alpha 1 [Paraburkholderia caribensis]